MSGNIIPDGSYVKVRGSSNAVWGKGIRFVTRRSPKQVLHPDCFTDDGKVSGEAPSESCMYENYEAIDPSDYPKYGITVDRALKISDLRIGNLVVHNGFLFKVYSLESPMPMNNPLLDSVDIVTLYDGGLISVPLSAVAPAPLTEAMLKMQGWCERIRSEPVRWAHEFENLYFAVIGSEFPG